MVPRNTVELPMVKPPHPKKGVALLVAEKKIEMWND
jgi:hypothetical protein